MHVHTCRFEAVIEVGLDNHSKTPEAALLISALYVFVHDLHLDGKRAFLAISILTSQLVVNFLAYPSRSGSTSSSRPAKDTQSRHDSVRLARMVSPWPSSGASLFDALFCACSTGNKPEGVWTIRARHRLPAKLYGRRSGRSVIIPEHCTAR